MSYYKLLEIDSEIIAIIDPLKQKELRQKKYEYFLKNSDIPSFYWNINFEDYKGNQESDSFKKIKYYADNLYKESFKFVNLYLWGIQATQKCLTKDTLILTERGFQYINEYSDSVRGFTEKNIQILSKEGICSTSHFFEEESNSSIKLELQNGIVIEGTPEHPLYVINPDLSYSFKSLKNITINDFIVVKKNTSIFNKNPYKINFNYIKKHMDTKSIDLCNIPDYMNSDLSRFLGYYIANGNKDKNSLTISTKNKKIKDDIEKIVSSFGLNLSLSNKDIIYNSIRSVQFKKLIYTLISIEDDYNFTARYKFVPTCILQGTKENQIDFLRALIDCDSYYNNKQNRLGYFTASEKLAREVQLLLLNLGVYSNLYKDFDKKYQHIYWELWITGEEVEKYFNLISYSLKYDFTSKKVSYKLNYSIPYLREYTYKEILKLRSILGVNKGGAFQFEGKTHRFKLGKVWIKLQAVKSITREVLYEIYKQLESFEYYDKEDIIKNLLTIYEKLINYSDFVYIPVRNKELKNESVVVYDFTVPNNHNFYSNGMISHNTALSCNILKQAMKQGLRTKFVLAGDLIDILMKLQGFNYKEDLYNYIEDLKNNYDVIVIDDIGDIQKSMMWQNNPSLVITEWDRFLRKVLYNDKTRVVMTSNFDVTIFKQYFGDSIYSLIDRNFEKIQLFDSIKEIRKLNVSQVFNDMYRRGINE